MFRLKDYNNWSTQEQTVLLRAPWQTAGSRASIRSDASFCFLLISHPVPLLLHKPLTLLLTLFSSRQISIEVFPPLYCSLELRVNSLPPSAASTLQSLCALLEYCTWFACKSSADLSTLHLNVFLKQTARRRKANHLELNSMKCVWDLDAFHPYGVWALMVSAFNSTDM